MDIETMRQLIRRHLDVEMETRPSPSVHYPNLLRSAAVLPDGRHLIGLHPEPAQLNDPDYHGVGWTLAHPCGSYLDPVASFSSLPEAIATLLTREVSVAIAGVPAVTVAIFRILPRPGCLRPESPCPPSPTEWEARLLIHENLPYLDPRWDSPRVVEMFLDVVEGRQDGNALLDWLADNDERVEAGLLRRAMVWGVL